MILKLQLDDEHTLVGVLGDQGKIYWFFRSVKRFFRKDSFDDFIVLPFSLKDVADDEMMEDYPCDLLQYDVMAHTSLLFLMQQYLEGEQKTFLKSFFYVRVTKKSHFYLLTCCLSTDPGAVAFWPWINCHRRPMLSKSAVTPPSQPSATHPTPNPSHLESASVSQVNRVSSYGVSPASPAYEYSPASPAYEYSPASPAYEYSPASPAYEYSPASPAYEYSPASPSFVPPSSDSAVVLPLHAPRSPSYTPPNSPRLSHRSEYDSDFRDQSPMSSTASISVTFDKLPPTKVIIRTNNITRTFYSSADH